MQNVVELGAKMQLLLVIACAVLLLAPAAAADKHSEQALPPGFVYLRNVAPSVVQDIRYATDNNFTGRRVDGYDADECILHLDVAEAISKVQAELKLTNLSLKVYDCYRPLRAVATFFKWVAEPADAIQSRRFHPSVPKHKLFAKGYIASHSSHSTGYAVDAGLISISAIKYGNATSQVNSNECSQNRFDRSPDDGLDFGTGYDCFDVMSHTQASGLTAEQVAVRRQLVNAMSSVGFKNYHREWWHFTFKNGGTQSYDIPVKSRPVNAPPN